MNRLHRIAFRSHAAKDDKGQAMAEYGVVLAVLCVAAVGVFTGLSKSVAAIVDRAVDLIPG